MSIRTAVVTFTGVTPYSQSRYTGENKGSREPGDAFERRALPAKLHADPDGHVVIPAMALKWMMLAAAKYLGESIPGAGKKQFGGPFGSAVSVKADVPIGHKAADVTPDKNSAWFLMNADGKRGSGTRVPRLFPVFNKWAGVAEFIVTDDRITPEVFARHLAAAGEYIGLGRFRPQAPTCGTNGKFRVEDIAWK